MAHVGKCLADGQLPSLIGTLYTVPVDTVAYIKRLKFTNTNAAEQTVLIYKRCDGVNDRLIGRAVLSQFQMLVIDQEVLEAGDLVRGVSTDANAVDYTIDGVEEA